MCVEWLGWSVESFIDAVVAFVLSSMQAWRWRVLRDPGRCLVLWSHLSPVACEMDLDIFRMGSV